MSQWDSPINSVQLNSQFFLRIGMTCCATFNFIARNRMSEEILSAAVLSR